MSETDYTPITSHRDKSDIAEQGVAQALDVARDRVEALRMSIVGGIANEHLIDNTTSGRAEMAALHLIDWIDDALEAAEAAHKREASDVALLEAWLRRARQEREAEPTAADFAHAGFSEPVMDAVAREADREEMVRRLSAAAQTIAEQEPALLESLLITMERVTRSKANGTRSPEVTDHGARGGH